MTNVLETMSRLRGRSLGAILCLVAAGCASRGAPKIPVGEWYGEGSFTFEQWGEPENTVSVHRDYDTWLRITNSEVEGRPALELEIISERGELPELGRRTHLRVALVEVKRCGDEAVLFRVAGPDFDPKPDQRPRFDHDTPPVGASLIQTRDYSVLQIAYQAGFVDTFRFRGKSLMKAGSFTVEDGSIHWVEALVQRRPVDLISASPPFHSLAGG